MNSAILTTQMLNFTGFVNETAVSSFADDGKTQDEERPRRNFSSLKERSWLYQSCTQLGFFHTGDRVPEDQLSLVSRTITLEYLQNWFCHDTFNIATPPDTDSINAYGGFDVAYDRLAFIDGESGYPEIRNTTFTHGEE